MHDVFSTFLHACLFYVLTRILCILSKCKHGLSITTTATTTTTQTPSEEGWEMRRQPLRDDYLTLLKCTPCACSCYLFDTRSLRNKKKKRKDGWRFISTQDHNASHVNKLCSQKHLVKHYSEGTWGRMAHFMVSLSIHCGARVNNCSPWRWQI